MENNRRSGIENFAYTNKCTVWTVFSGKECIFNDYITRASNMHYGLSRKELTELAYEFVKET
jgi:hypothetical protein